MAILSRHFSKRPYTMSSRTTTLMVVIVSCDVRRICNLTHITIRVRYTREFSYVQVQQAASVHTQGRHDDDDVELSGRRSARTCQLAILYAICRVYYHEPSMFFIRSENFCTSVYTTQLYSYE